MAYQTKSLSAAEHDYYITALAAQGVVLPSSIPFSELKRRFLRYFGSMNATDNLVVGERKFLKLWSNSSSNSIPDLWKVFGAAYGIDGTNKSVNQIKYEFFIKNVDLFA